ncbi:MAG TPA: metal-dependent hydrolase [Acidobacteriaceae bacterium]|nr:metal-dependent hydrolase [Acidobacteriaceae bacterium]
MTHWKNLSITWLGHAAVHITTPKGTEILIDPFFEHNPKFPKDYKLPAHLDLLLLTHAHMDHIADAVPVAKKHGPNIVAIYELASWVGTKGVQNTIGMNLGGSYKHKDVTVTMVEARHSAGLQDGDRVLYGGEPAGFVLTIEDAPVLYHAGDTSLFSDMRLIKELYAPEVGMIPIGDHFTMGPKAAALASDYLGLKTIIPIHYGTFPQLTGTPAELKEHLKGKKVEVLTPQPGETLR